MSFIRDSQGFYRSSLLAGFDWFDHAFGTAEAVPEPGYLLLKQIHSTRVVEAAECHAGTEADAMFTASSGVRLAVKTADCVPILMADPVRRIVAAVHAGWRGTAAGIVRAAVSRLARDCESRPQDLVAALGPSIGPCCYEVGPEVAGLFRPVATGGPDHDGRVKIDLRRANRDSLIESGLAPGKIDEADVCTCCGGAEFHSWRRDRIEGARMFSVIGIRPL